MKKNIVLLLTALVAFIIASCTNPGLIPGEVPGTDSNATGTVRFSWSDGEQASRSRANNNTGRANTILDADKVVITIEAADGTVVYSQKQLNLFNFNGSFISEPLSLKVGNYKLTEYLILDSAGTVIFATPKAGSAQAHLVTMPLPQDFTVTKDGTTKVKPQVVDAAAVNPADFGYTTFSFEEAKVFNFLVAVMVYDATADNFVLTDAALDVTTDVKAYSYSLANVTNNLAINDVAGNYTVTVKKAGYVDHVATYTNAEMKAFFQSPLVVVLMEGQTPVDYVITFADPGLESVVRATISRPTGDIYKSDVSGLTKFRATNANISNLGGIEHLSSLIELNLSSNSLTDITPLSALTNLQILKLGDNQVGNLTPLSPLTQLTTLELYRNGVTDISPLSTLVNMTFLQLAMNKVVDITALSSMTNLATLYINSNTVSDILPLAPLTKLQVLYLGSNKVSDLSPLSTATELRVLTLGSNYNISDLSPLTSMTRLEELIIVNNNITDITPLSALTAMRKLTMNVYTNGNISAISTMTEMRELTLSGHGITDLTALSTMTKMTTLKLLGRDTGDITPLAALVNLTYLDINGSGLTDITAVASMTKLSTLILRNNQISDISPLLNNTGLGTNDSVNITGNPLNADATTVHIPALQAKGVNVIF